jgi:hypothetical protein
MNLSMIVQLMRHFIQGSQQDALDMLAMSRVAFHHANKVIHIYIPIFDWNRLARPVPDRFRGAEIGNGSDSVPARVSDMSFSGVKCVSDNTSKRYGKLACLVRSLLSARSATVPVAAMNKGGGVPSHWQNQGEADQSILSILCWEHDYQFGNIIGMSGNPIETI